jgi:hypothetical protein
MRVVGSMVGPENGFSISTSDSEDPIKVYQYRDKDFWIGGTVFEDPVEIGGDCDGGDITRMEC